MNVLSALTAILITSVCVADEPDGFYQLLAGTKDFDGLADCVDLKVPAEVRNHSQTTVAGWIYPHRRKGVFTSRCLVTQSKRLWLMMECSYPDPSLDRTGPLVCYLYTQKADGGWSHKRLATPTHLELDRWSHVAMTYDREKLRLFLDGELVAALEETGALSKHRKTDEVTVGCLRDWTKSSFWAGSLRDLRQYGRALAQEEIEALAARRPAEPEAGFVFRSDSSPVWVLNGGLEGDYKDHSVRSVPTPWYGNIIGKAKGRFKKETEHPHSGEAAVMLEWEDLPAGTARISGMSFNEDALVPLIPGRTYTLSAWMRTDVEGIEVWMGIHNIQELRILVKPTRRWDKYSFSKTYTGVTNAEFINFGHLWKEAANLYIDDIELTVEK